MLGDQWMARLSSLAKNKVAAEPEVKHMAPPSQQQLEAAVAWLVAGGAELEGSRLLVAASVRDGLENGRSWAPALQAAVNKAVRENWPDFQKFSANWLTFWDLLDEIRILEKMLDEADA